MKKFSEFKIQEQGEFEKKQESNKKELQKLYRKVKSLDGPGPMTALPIFQADKIEYVK